VNKALDHLKSIDERLYHEITSFQCVFLECFSFPVLGNRRYANYTTREFTISLNDQTWKDYGIIGRIYFVYLNSFQSKEAAALEVANWLGKHGCPQVLVDFWHKSATPKPIPSEQ
jgi:hypothetical protein